MNPEEENNPLVSPKPENPFQISPEHTDPSISSSLKQIRTYQGDVASALHNQNESLISIKRAEVARSMDQVKSGPDITPEEVEEKKSARTGILLFVGTIILLIAGGVWGYFSYQTYKAKVAVPVVVSIPNAFFGTDTYTNINALSISRDALIQKIEERRTVVNGGIEQIQLRKGEGNTASLLNTEGLLAILQSHAPQSLIRAFNPLFMLGTLGSSPKHTFIIIKLDSYENAFPGMLEWEHNMALDILPLIQNQSVIDSVPSETQFKDITIQNKDARVLRSPNGSSVLLYSFFDNNMVIITENEETLRSIITRLTSQKLTR